MSKSKWVVVAITAAICSPVFASNIGSDFLDAQIYKRLQAGLHSKHKFEDWFANNFLKRVSVTGNQNLGLHAQQVNGDTTAYASETAFGQGNQTLTQTGQMNIALNNVMGILNGQIGIADNRYQDPTQHRYSLNYDKGPWKIDAGNIQATLVGGNQFLQFSRQVTGVSLGYTGSAFSIRVLDSQATSSTSTVPIPGNNSPGPYYLSASQIVTDSVRVQVDGRELTYPNDFTVDPVVGSITFTTLSVPPTSTIVVSYESTGVNSGGGSIQGVGGLLGLGPFGSLGFSAIRQLDPSGDGLSAYVQRFQGFGDPSTPYVLDYVPLQSQPITVTLDGIVQISNIDYQINPTNPTFLYFLRYINPTSTITVTYTPTPNSTLRGDRQVLGFDYSMPLGKKGKSGAITYSEAFSHLSSPITPLSGIAKGLTATYKLKRFTFTGGVDDIPPTYVGISGTSFVRNEQAANAGVEYKAGHLTASLQGTNSAISTETTGPNGDLIFQPARTTSLDGGLKYAGSSGITWSFDQQHLTNWGIDGAARADETTFSFAKLIGKLNNHFNLSHTEGYGPISDGLTSTFGSVRLDSIGWIGDYVAAQGLTIGGHTTLSEVDTAGTSGLGTDMALSVAYRRPDRPYGFDASYTFSNSGEIATLGSFQDGFGTGYNGNGFTGGATGNSTVAGQSGFNGSGTDVRRLQGAVSYNIAKRASLGANAFTSREYGALSTNSDSLGFGVTLDYDLRGNQRLGLSLNQSNTVFAGATESANSTSLDLFEGGHPKGNWSYRLAVGSLLSSGGTIAQNSFHYDFTLTNYFKRNQAIGLDVTSSSLTNYQPQNDFQIALSYQYQLFKSCALLGKYQIHNVMNLDPTVTTGAYSSRGFDFELNFNFGS